METNYPLVSLCLFSYNNEKFIEEALVGMFSQDYPNLEFIVSDDCSTDRTWGIINEFIKKLDSSLRIIKNRNDFNLGIGKHVSYIHSLTSGKYIAHFSGDDISLSFRVSESYKMISEDPRNVLVASDVFFIDSRGNQIDRNAKEVPLIIRSLKTFATTFMFDRALVDKFSKPYGRIPSEDNVLVARSALLGTSVVVGRPLVKYRLHDSSAWATFVAAKPSSKQILENEARRFMDYIFMETQLLHDRASVLEATVLDYSFFNKLFSYRLNYRVITEKSLCRSFLFSFFSPLYDGFYLFRLKLVLHKIRSRLRPLK